MRKLDEVGRVAPGIVLGVSYRTVGGDRTVDIGGRRVGDIISRVSDGEEDDVV